MTTGDSVTILSIFLLQGLFNGADIMVVQKVAAHTSPDLSSPVINSFRKWRCQDLGPSQLSSTAHWRADIPHSESGKFSSFLSQQPPRCQRCSENLEAYLNEGVSSPDLFLAWKVVISSMCCIPKRRIPKYLSVLAATIGNCLETFRNVQNTLRRCLRYQFAAVHFSWAGTSAHCLNTNGQIDWNNQEYQFPFT